MMQVVLLILKLAGIILLVLLGLVLFLVLTALFVPLRYNVRGDWHGQVKADARVHWLFHILSIRAGYDQKEGLLMKVRVFGIPIWRFRREEPGEAADGGQPDNDVTDALQRALDLDEKKYRESAEKKLRRGKAGSRETSGESRGGAGYRAGEELLEAQELGMPGEERGGAGFHTEAEEKNDRTGSGFHTETEEEGQRQETASKPETEEDNGPVVSIFRKIAAFVKKTLEKLRFSFQEFYGKLKKGMDFVRDKREWLENEKNQASLRFLWKQARRLISHLWPVKGRGTVTFGFDDPYRTGQVLQAVSLIYPFYHKQLSIYPVFDRQVLEGEGSFRGRIRLGFLLWLALQVYFDRYTWKLIRSFL